MGLLMNEMLFYGGIALAAAALLAGLIFFCISQVIGTRLMAQLDSEYGPRVDEKKQKKTKKR